MPLPCLHFVLLLPCAATMAMPASAMNWEGHDESLKDIPGIEAFTAGTQHKPLPSPSCPVARDAAKSNPYEQIPLPGHGCAPPMPKADAQAK